MFRMKRFVAVIAGLALLLAVTSYGIVADSQGLSVTSPAFACENGSPSGGGC